MEFKFTDPATDFTDGLQVIKDYHAHFLACGKKLLALVEQMAQEGMNESLANRSIELHCHYFHAHRLHHLDEEQALFPFLEQQSKLFDGMVDLLIDDHEAIEEGWEKLSKLLGNPENISDIPQFKELSSAFEKRLREHLIREDEDFLPKVDLLLSASQKQQAGALMQKLRVSGSTST